MNDYDPNFRPIKQYSIVGQKIVISNSKDKILVLQRSDKSGGGGQWSLAGGGLDNGEKSETGILREVEEETQLTVNNPKPFFVKTYMNNDDFVVIIAYKAKLRGGKVILNWEHDSYKWVSKDEALEMNLTPDARDIISKWSSNDLPPLSTDEDVLKLYSDLEKIDVKIWLDGGWGVDALLKKQTRLHEDIDIVIQEKDIPQLREYLNKKGYKDVERDDTSAWNFVLGDDLGHLVDVHVIVLDENGNGIYGPIENGVMFSKNSLLGLGEVSGKVVNCLTAEYQVESHSGYKLREHDYNDVSALCEKFSIELPEEYQNF